MDGKLELEKVDIAMNLADVCTKALPGNCLLNPCDVVAQLVTSQLVAVDTTMTFFLTLGRLGPKSDHEKTARIIHCAQRTFTRFVLFPTLAWYRSQLPWNCGIER